MKSLIVLPVVLLLMRGLALADTIYTKDGQELKGVIVEEYYDRVVLSTLNGGLPVLKQDIEKITYDSAEEDYLKLGDSYKDRGDYETALYYYEAASKLNPDLKQAQEGTLLVTNLLLRKKQTELEQQVKLKQDTEENIGVQDTEKPLPDPLESRRQELLDKAGIAIELKGGAVMIEKAVTGSVADAAGIRAGDSIVAVWGKLVKYMQLKDVYDLLVASGVSEIRLTISRKVTADLKRSGMFNSAEKIIGAKLEIKFEGLTVGALTAGGPFEKAGVQKGDIVIVVEDVPTRYMPLETICQLIEKLRGNILNIGIQREIVFWKKG
ncbi:MAG: PDZ domain-containing protein [Candidatus Omnitrophica bacterium]|nr:PDZ domain-containing protein [Candidatus Omnitrophota bacterium]